MAVINDTVELDEYSQITRISLQWKLGEPLNIRRCTKTGSKFLFEIRQKDVEQTYLVDTERGTISVVHTEPLPIMRSTRLGEKHHKWLPEELKFVESNPHAPTKLLSDHLIHHTFSSVQTKRHQLFAAGRGANNV